MATYQQADMAALASHLVEHRYAGHRVEYRDGANLPALHTIESGEIIVFCACEDMGGGYAGFSGHAAHIVEKAVQAGLQL